MAPAKTGWWASPATSPGTPCSIRPRPKTAVEFSPGRTHVMLSGLKAPLRRGETFKLQLKFERSGHRQAVIKVLDPSSAGLQEAR